MHGRRRNNKYQKIPMVEHSGDVQEGKRSVLSASEAYYLLKDLWVGMGYCLPPDKLAELETNPPTDIDVFTRAVFTAEGMDPELVDRQDYRAVRAVVAAAFERAARKSDP